MLKNKSKVILSVLSLSLASMSLPEVQASVEGFNVDALVGLNMGTGGVASSPSSLGYGGRLGYHLNKNWELGGGFTTTGNTVSVTSPTGAANYSSSTNTSLVLADINYHLDGSMNPLYFGFRLGVGLNSGTSTDPNHLNSTSSTNLAYGVVSGYDFKVGQSFTAGPRVSYTQIQQDAKPNIGDFQAHAAFKYFF